MTVPGDQNAEDGKCHERDAEDGRIHVEVGAQAAAYAGQLCAFHVAVEFLRGFLILVRGGVVRLVLGYALGTAEDVYDAEDHGFARNSVLSYPFAEELRHAFLDPFGNLGVGIVSGHLLEVAVQFRGGFRFEREGVSAYADFFYLFHFLRVSIAFTISCQAVSMSAS